MCVGYRLAFPLANQVHEGRTGNTSSVPPENPSFCSEHKELGRHHPVVTTNKTLNRLKKLTTLRGYTEWEGHRAKAAPKIGEAGRQIQGVVAEQGRDS